MKKTLRILSFFVGSVFLLTSCAKYDKLLDIDLKNMEIDGNMHWGIPLIDAGYSIDEVLNQFGDMGFIQYDDNGDYRFEYIIPKEDYIDISQFSGIDDNSEIFTLECLNSKNNEYQYPFPGRKINLSAENMKVNTALLQSGLIKFEIKASSNVPSDIYYEAYITSHSILDENFAINLSKDKPTEFTECNGLRVKTDDSKLVFDILITLYPPTGTTPPDGLVFYIEISIIDVKLEEAEIELLDEYTQPFVSATVFSLFSDNTSLIATLHNPELWLDITNTFGSDLQLMLSKIYLKGKTGTTSLLIEENVQILIPVNTGLIDLTPHIKSDIPLYSSYDSLIFDCVAIAPAGPFIIFENSVIVAGAILTVPFNITVAEAIFNDTLAFNLPGLSNLSIIDTVEVRAVFNSSIPANFGVQVLLYNSEKQEILGALMEEPLRIKGSFDGNFVPTVPQFITVTNSSLKSLQDADKLILQLSLDTEGTSKNFNKSNSLQARVGARIKTATNF